VPELLNRSFLWHEEYHHYGDWEMKMRECYDNFNMLFVRWRTDEPKLFFDMAMHKRRIPVGIVPHPFMLRRPV